MERDTVRGDVVDEIMDGKKRTTEKENGRQ